MDFTHNESLAQKVDFERSTKLPIKYGRRSKGYCSSWKCMGPECTKTRVGVLRRVGVEKLPGRPNDDPATCPMCGSYLYWVGEHEKPGRQY